MQKRGLARSRKSTFEQGRAGQIPPRPAPPARYRERRGWSLTPLRLSRYSPCEAEREATFAQCMEQLLFIGFPAAVAVPLTVLFCRHQIARQKPISFGTVCLGTISAYAIVLLCAIGPGVLSSWSFIWSGEYFSPLPYLLIMCGGPLLICVASAAFVVFCYRFQKWVTYKRER